MTSTSTCGARYGGARLVRRERARIDQRARARRHRLRALLADEVGGARPCQRPERGRGVERVAEPVLPHLRDEGLHEAVVHRAVYVDALDPAARLARVEEGAVHQVLDGVRERRVGAHVGGVLAAELEARRDEALGRRALHDVPALDGAGEGHEVDLGAPDHARHGVVVAVQELEHAAREPGRGERLAEALGRERRLLGVLQDHRVPGERAQGTTAFTAVRYG